MLRDVVFLDRDGVINRNSPDYIKRVEEFEFLPGSLEALRRFTENGCTIIVVTNQSVLHRRMMTRTVLDEIHRRMRRAVADHGGAIHDILVCPHLPEEGCPCRKPKPGMLLAARWKHRVDFASALMIGDSVKDIECGWAAGVKTTVLVRTGHGTAAERELLLRGKPPDLIVEDLLQAALEIRGLRAPAR